MCLVIDRLPAHLVGAYGNTWIRSPAFDALAAESLLCEFATIDSPDLEQLYRGYWRGVHAACPAKTSDAEQHRPSNTEHRSSDLPSLLRAQGVRSIVVTDEPAVANLPLTSSFDELVRVQGNEAPVTAESVESTRMGKFFAAAADVIEAAPTPSLVWIHAQGLAGPWDAPLDLRNFYADDEDPDPPTFVEPPNRLLAADHDPDERLGAAQAASGQVSALDECLEQLLAVIDQVPNRHDTLLIVLGARGFPLGEHLRLGPCDEALYEELVHVPLLIRVPGREAPLRTPALVQTADIFATLSDWFGQPSAEQQPASPAATSLPSCPIKGASLLPLVHSPQLPIRDRAVCLAPTGQWSIRTSAWYVRHTPPNAEAPDSAQHELYVKPDDRFEQNDVARRCGDIVERLTAAGKSFLNAAATQDEKQLPPLEAELMAAD